MRIIFIALFIFIVTLSNPFAEEKAQTADLSEEDIEVIQNLEILEELEMFNEIDLVENYEAIKNVEVLEEEGEPNEENNN